MSKFDPDRLKREVMKRAELHLSQKATQHVMRVNAALATFDCPVCGKAAPFHAYSRKESGARYTVHISGCCEEGAEKAQEHIRPLIRADLE